LDHAPGNLGVPVYTLIPDEHDFEPEEFVAADAARLLEEIHGLGWNAALVLQDGNFAFTLPRSSKGVWSILPSLPDAPEASEHLTSTTVAD
jgi:hypothetical protein